MPWGLGVAVHLSMLAVNAGVSPGPNGLLETVPDKLSCHKALAWFPAWGRPCTALKIAVSSQQGRIEGRG